MGLEELWTTAVQVRVNSAPDSLIVFGAAFDAVLKDEMRVEIFVTGTDKKRGGR